jgi:hypothetical protein
MEVEFEISVEAGVGVPPFELEPDVAEKSKYDEMTTSSWAIKAAVSVYTLTIRDGGGGCCWEEAVEVVDIL